ncbi:MAG: hypothetical protein QNJ72_16605 [Pleurocapsa sp. MO_226.B13]|nr:hypothetical protein [Pleurocapsa sp. MO_226.B13]
MPISSNNHFHQDTRILVWSQRNIENFIYNSCLYEFEDIISSVDAVDLVAPPQYDLIGKGINKLVKTQTKYFKYLTHLNPYRQVRCLEREYEVQYFSFKEY